MNWRFSLRGLLAAVTLAAVGCAALARPDEWRTAIVATASSCALVALAVRAVAWPGKPRLESCGGLIGAAGYLLLVFAPWFDVHVGPYLLPSRIVNLAEAAASKHLPGAEPPQPSITTIWNVDSGMPLVTSTTISGLTLIDIASNRTRSNFHVIGHWLFAWVAGAAGFALMGGQISKSPREPQSDLANLAGGE